MTTAYQAGLETTNTQLSYANESVWATLPSSTFQAARIMSESLKHVKTRTRPPEIRGDRQAGAPVTTQESASGSIVLPVYASSGASASPFEDFLSSTMGANWSAVATIAGAAGDITLSSAGLLTSTTGSKFAALKPAQVIRLSGFTNAANNGVYRITSIASPTSVQLAPLDGSGQTTETPAGTAAQVIHSNLRNGSLFKSMHIQERLDTAGSKWFRYAGAYMGRAQVSLSLGQYAQATFDVMARDEAKALADASTGGIVAAPDTKDMDPVAGFKGIFWNDVALTSGVDQFSLDLNNEGAAGEYALGSALAQGMIQGTFTGSAKFRAYFRDFTLYDLFRAETTGVLTIRMADRAGNQYAFTAPNTTLLIDNGVPVDGPNKAIMLDVTAELSADAVSGCTLSVDRFLAP